MVQAPGKMQEDFAVVKEALNLDVSLGLLDDTSGKKAALHPLCCELLNLVNSVLTLQQHFSTFQAADAMNKSFTKTCLEESLVNLSWPTIVNPWKDANTAFEGVEAKKKKEQDKDAEGEDSEAEEGLKKPTRSEAIEVAAKSEVKNYCPHYVMTGDASLDRNNLLSHYSVTKHCLLYTSPSPRDS